MVDYFETKKGIAGIISHVKPVNALFYDIVVDMPG